MQLDGQRAGHMAVAGAGLAQPGGRTRLERRARYACHDQQRFQRGSVHGAAGDIGGARIDAGQTILLVLAAAGRPFGHGRHASPGQALARTIATQALSHLGALPDVDWHYLASPNARLAVFTEREVK
ncbi:hypothetical protein ACFFTM_07455 [Pseudoduganella plicata]|nr:hypothetical protein [Pseudoduganella plicata]